MCVGCSAGTFGIAVVESASRNLDTEKVKKLQHELSSCRTEHEADTDLNSPRQAVIHPESVRQGMLVTDKMQTSDGTGHSTR